MAIIQSTNKKRKTPLLSPVYAPCTHSLYIHPAAASGTCRREEAHDPRPPSGRPSPQRHRRKNGQGAPAGCRTVERKDSGIRPYKAALPGQGACFLCFPISEGRNDAPPATLNQFLRRRRRALVDLFVRHGLPRQPDTPRAHCTRQKLFEPPLPSYLLLVSSKAGSAEGVFGNNPSPPYPLLGSRHGALKLWTLEASTLGK